MIFKKTIITLLVLIAGIGASAQFTDGAWTFYPASSPNVTNVCPTRDGAYILFDKSLYWYSPGQGESYAFSPVNRLSESEDICMIEYFDEGKFLFVGYVNGNIDLVYPSGEVVNMADIKDAILTGSHQMTCVAYKNGRLYVGMDFGMVVFDTNRHEVIESGQYGSPVKSLAVVDDHILAIVKYTVYGAPVDGKHPSLDSFQSLWGTNASQLVVMGSSVVFRNHNDNSLFIQKLDFSQESPRGPRINISGAGDLSQPLRSLGDKVAYVADNVLSLCDEEGNVTSRALPEGFLHTAAYPADGFSNVWVSAFGKGVALYDLTGTPTLKSDFYLPEGITVPRINYMTWKPDGSGLYVGRYVTTAYNQAAGGSGDNFDMIQYTNLVEGDHVTDVSPKAVNPDLLAPSMATGSAGYPRFYSPLGVAGAPNNFVADPVKPDRYYLANNLYGILVIDGNEIVHIFQRQNLPTPPERWGERTMDVNVDNYGNLWVCSGYTAGPSTSDFVHAYMVLPAEKLQGDLKKIKRSDWIDARVPNDFTGGRDMKSIFCKKSNLMVAYISGTVGWLFMDNNGTPLDFSDDTRYYHCEFYDQDGSAISVFRPQAVAEDKSGRIWMGYDTGVFYTTPQDAVQSNLRVKRPIVPRNDGTEFGDFLLDSEDIYSIAADHSDRKWFATANNGIYLVNPDGTKILKHFTKENSPLPSNMVYYVTVDPNSNRVYFATEGGLVVYDSDSSPAAEDFSEVYAYPNPVRPEYTGDVTIAGLMENSTVKIADAAGNVLFHSRSEGGMVSWNACDANGRRVRSGVYYVLAQSDASGSKEAVVSKILVIN